jgi:hypothetical protein
MTLHLRYHHKLNQKLFDGDELKPAVSMKLHEIATSFVEFSKIPKDIVVDAIVTGSNMNLNYTSKSDIDLHILIRKNKLTKELGNFVDEYLLAKRQAFAAAHKPTIKGYPVELYFQDDKEKLVAMGQYSLKNDIWLEHPQDMHIQFYRNKEIEIQANKYQCLIDELIATNADNGQFKDLKEKLRTLRKEGLESPEGEFSLNNSIWKELRARGVFTRLQKFLQKRSDKALSLESVQMATPKQIQTIKKLHDEIVLLTIENKIRDEIKKHYEQPTEDGFDLTAIMQPDEPFSDLYKGDDE